MNLGNVQTRLMTTFTEDEVNETIAYCGFDFVPSAANKEYCVAAITLYFGNCAMNPDKREDEFYDQLIEGDQPITEDQLFNYIASRFCTIGRKSPVAGTPERTKFLQERGYPQADDNYDQDSQIEPS